MKSVKRMKLRCNALSVVRINYYYRVTGKHNFFFLIFCCSTGKQMKHINHFKIHMRSHRSGVDNQNNTSNPLSTESKKKFLCPTCGRACTSQSNLAVHIRRHTGLMTNFCKVCGKGYPRSTDLTIHMRFV